MDMLDPKQLKQTRRKAGLTQESFANIVGVSVGYLSKIEKGKKVPGKGLRKRIAEVLEKGLPMDNQQKTDEQEILAAYRKLSGINKARAHAYITALTHSQSPALNRP